MTWRVQHREVDAACSDPISVVQIARGHHRGDRKWCGERLGFNEAITVERVHANRKLFVMMRGVVGGKCGHLPHVVPVTVGGQRQHQPPTALGELRSECGE